MAYYFFNNSVRNLNTRFTMKNNKIHSEAIARRGSDQIASQALHILYDKYPKSISIHDIGKMLDLSEKIVIQSIKQIEDHGVPIEHQIKDSVKYLKANIKEPVFWIIKERIAAEKMLILLKNSKLNGNEDINNQKKINLRIYNEYLQTLNDLFDKWNSLRLIEKLDKKYQL